MIPSEPETRSPVEPAHFDSAPTVIYDLDDGTVQPTVGGKASAASASPPLVSSAWGDHNDPFEFKEKDPLSEEIGRVTASFRSLGFGIKSATEEFKGVTALVRSEKGIVKDFLSLIWDDVSLWVRRLLPIALAMILVPASIYALVKLHQKPVPAHHRPTAESAGTEERTTDSQRAIESYAHETDKDLGILAPASNDNAMPQVLKGEVATMIARMEYNNARRHDDPALPSTFIADALAAPAVQKRPKDAAASNGKTPDGLLGQLPPSAAGSVPRGAAPPTGAGIGVLPPGTDDSAQPSRGSKNQDEFTNGDENAIMLELYKEYAAAPHTALGREAGGDLARIYWLRADDDVHHGNTAQALTDWRRVAAFDPADPIARAARRKMQLHRAKGVPRKHPAQRSSKAKSRITHTHHA